MRTVTKLSKMNGRVYVYLKDEPSLQKFLSDAEKEDFTFCDSIKPTARKEQTDLYAVNPDKTINFVGHVGHLAFRYSDKMGVNRFIKIDYAKYQNNEENYIIH